MFNSMKMIKEKKLKVCQFIDSYFPTMDGGLIVAHNYAKFLSKMGFESFLIAPGSKKYKKPDYKSYLFFSIPILGMHPYRIGIPYFDTQFKKEIKNIKFDIVHSHSPFLTGHLALKIAKRQKIPHVTTFHTKWKEDFKKVIKNDFIVNLFIKYVASFYNKADVVWVPNESTGKELVKYGFKGKYEIMQNGCDMEIDKKEIKKLREMSLSEGIREKGDFVILFVGQHRWEKGVKIILDSLKILKEKNENFKMIFVGEGYARKDMENFVKQFNLEKNVKFTGLIVDREKLKKIYAAADLYVFPSKYDNSPLTVQEAAAFYIPSILLKDSSAAEPIINNSNGFTIAYNPFDLANKIKFLIRKPKLIKAAGNNARKTIYHPWKDVLEDVKVKYLNIIDVYNKKLIASKKLIEIKKRRNN
jgi:1,2-diacylglycerol 3-alpha-glucosyltransferase